MNFEKFCRLNKFFFQFCQKIGANLKFFLKSCLKNITKEGYVPHKDS
jgi:hypothetical protein